MTEKTLRRKARDLGYSIKKGYQALCYGRIKDFYYDDTGEKISGYMIYHNSYGVPVAGICENKVFSLTLDDVFEFFDV